MPGKYAHLHGPSNEKGPGDARPTALQIVQDENLTNALPSHTYVVTGCSSGIGPPTASALASTGAKVLMTVRSLSKGREACKSFLEPGRVELVEMDNMSLQSVRGAARAILEMSGGTLNGLLCNAGIMAAPFERTVDGFESQFGVNHLSHFLLFRLLEDALLKGAEDTKKEGGSRVVMVSSIGHAAGEVQFGNYDFKGGEEYTEWKGYGQSKTANIYMANEIENRFGDKGLHGLSLHPGGIWTGLQKFVPDDTMKEWKARPGVGNHLKSCEQGAATSVYAMVGEAFEGRGRLYLVDCDVEDEKTEKAFGVDGKEGYSPYIYDKEKEKRLWEDSLKMVGLA